MHVTAVATAMAMSMAIYAAIVCLQLVVAFFWWLIWCIRVSMPTERKGGNKQEKEEWEGVFQNTINTTIAMTLALWTTTKREGHHMAPLR